MLDPSSLVVFAFLMAFMNDSLGGGYGTLSAPLLLILDYPAKVTVPAILASEASSELFSALWHVKFKNVCYRAFGLMTVGGIFGIAAAVLVIGVFLTSTAAKLYISAIAVLMGIFVIVKSFSFFTKYSQRDKPKRINMPLIVTLGMICGFNKSSTGGGYGPLSTSGFQVLGLAPAEAVGTTIITKGTACLISIVMWSGFIGIDLSVTIPMVIGALIGAPFAAWLNNYLKHKMRSSLHSRFLGVIMSLLGLYSLLKTLKAI
jgi:uncharacterized membrane protein YfcA